MDQAALRKILGDIPLGSIRFFDSVGSTNDLAANWARKGAPNLSLVVSDEQTAGRGRKKRRWYTPPGTALAFSLIMQDSPLGDLTPNSQLSRLTALGTLAVCGALGHTYPEKLEPQIKWPNDVLVAGKKLAGVLCEAFWQGEQLDTVILGIGINITSESMPAPELLDFPATCLEAEVHMQVDRWDLLHTLLTKLLYWMNLLPSPAFIQAWSDNLAYRGTWVQVIFDDGSSLEGQVSGLRSDGSLILMAHSGEVVDVQSGAIRIRPLEGSS